jgi:hypothetical protein
MPWAGRAPRSARFFAFHSRAEGRLRRGRAPFGRAGLDSCAVRGALHALASDPLPFGLFDGHVKAGAGPVKLPRRFPLRGPSVFRLTGTLSPRTGPALFHVPSGRDGRGRTTQNEGTTP